MAKFQAKRLLTLFKPEARVFTVAMLVLGLGSGINLLFPEIIRRLINSSLLISQNALYICLLFFALFALQGVCFYFRSLLFAQMGQRIIARVRNQLYASIIHKSIEFFDRAKVGDLISRLSADCAALQEAMSIKLSVLVRYGLQVLFGVALMAYLSWKLTLSIIIVIPVLIGISMVLGKRLKAMSKKQQAALGSALSVAEESLAAARIIKAFNKDSYEITRFADKNTAVLEFGIQRSRISAFFASFVSFLLNLSIVVVLVFGLRLVNANQLSWGDLTAFLLFGFIVAISFAFLVGAYTEFVQAMASADRIFEQIDTTPAEDQAVAPLAFNGHLAFEEVSFAYPTRPEVTVLKSISLVFPKQKVTALVGPSGSGKSTIVNLVLGFYAINTGHIIVDGKSSYTQVPRGLRDFMALVPQDPQLFGVSIGENLRYGKADASDHELYEACRKASIFDFVDSLPEKLATNIGERGLQLSAGQRQRFAIARAILRNPLLLILDEATSALDSESEYLVQQALKELMRDRTSIVIAHRLSTIKNADQVLVLDKGQIVQCGKHEELCKVNGLYKQLVERQELRID